MRISNFIPALVLAGGLSFLVSCGGSVSGTVKVYDMGARVESGHLLYTVYETQWLPQLGAGDSARVPKKRFFLIRMVAVNSGSEEAYVPNVSIIDDQGQTVDELQDGDQVPQWMGFIRKAKPADSVSGNIVFDAEPKHYRLRVTDENGEKPALIDLPLNFNGDTPPALPSSSGSDFSSPPKK
jgi:hypothetical protein